MAHLALGVSGVTARRPAAPVSSIVANQRRSARPRVSQRPLEAFRGRRMSPFLSEMMFVNPCDPFETFGKVDIQFGTAAERQHDQRRMAIDMVETDTSFEVLADIPGYNKQEIQVDIDTDKSTLTISASRASPSKPSAAASSHADTASKDPSDVKQSAVADQSKADQESSGSDADEVRAEVVAPKAPMRKSMLSERSEPFEKRCLTLPTSADLAGTTAEFSNGTLQLDVPKRNLPSPNKRISIA